MMNQNLEYLRLFVRKFIESPTTRWRHHGIGLLQAYVEENDAGPEYRVHIWHPSLRLPDMEDSGLIHNHRFELESNVLSGAMRDTEIALKGMLNPGQFYRVWEIQNARAAGSDGWVKPQPEYVTIIENPHVYAAGTRYRYSAGAFHRSDVEELTVTFCVKRYPPAWQDVSARVLAREHAIPKHAFGGDPEQYVTHPRRGLELRALLGMAEDSLKGPIR